MTDDLPHVIEVPANAGETLNTEVEGVKLHIDLVAFGNRKVVEGFKQRQDSAKENYTEAIEENERLRKTLDRIRDVANVSPAAEQGLPDWARSSFGEISQMVQQELG